MKVVYISNKGETGGAARSQMALIEELKKKYDVTPIVLTYSKGILSKLCDEQGIENYALSYEPFMIGGGSTKLRKAVKTILMPAYKFRKSVHDKKALKAISKQIDFSGIDLIHTNTNRDDFGAILSEKYDVPHVWHIREFGDLDYDCIFLKSDAFKYMNSVKGVFITISDAVSRAWIEKGIDKTRVYRVYNGIDTLKYDSETKRSFAEKDLKFIFTGTLYENKGQIQVMKALLMLPKEVRSHITVDFYGGGAKEYIDYLLKWCDEHGIADRIKYCGFSKNLNNILPQYDGAFVCSKAEGFGRVTVEHMLSGLIVIASDSGANPELIVDGVSGFLYKSQDVKSLCDCIIKVYNNRECLPQITEAARKTVIDKFTKELNAEGVYSVYKKVVQQYGE